MLKMFEKLINEHGSSTILKERLELFSDKYSVLEEKLKVSEHNNKLLESENDKLRTELSQLRNKYEQLKENTQLRDEEKSILELDETKEKILQFLFQQGDEINLSHLCSQLSLDKSTAEYHLTALEEGKFIYTHYYQGDWLEGTSGYSSYEIEQEGRKYVIEKINR
jgi:DNA-binding transcriptional ArsR family regulator